MTIHSCALVLGCLLGLGMAEVALRLFWIQANRYYLWIPNQSYELRPTPDLIPGVGSVAYYHVNSQGIRASEWSTNREKEYRIITVGGSTTECLYLDQRRSWPSLLEQRLGETVDGRKVWIGNLGRAGFNTRDHLAFMQLVLDQYPIDAVLMLVGGNDMIHRLMAGNDFDPLFVQDGRRYLDWLSTRFAVTPVSMGDPRQPFYKRMAVWKLLKKLIGRPDHRNVSLDRTGKWLRALRQQRLQAQPAADLPSLDSGLHEYQRNIEAIIREARQRALRIVFLTQPFLWRETMSQNESSLLWWGSRPDGKFYTSGALAQAIESYNRRLIEVCTGVGVECIDMASRIPHRSDYFFDDTHFTEAGSERFAAELAAELKQRPPFAH